MTDEVTLISRIQRLVLYILVALFPLFFLPFTQEYFLTGKMYFLFFGSLVLLVLSAFELLLSKKLVWEKRPYDNVAVLFFVAVVLSVVFSSPNKVQALVTPGYGVMSMFSYLILYFYLSRDKSSRLKQMIIYIPAAVLSATALFFVMNPFKNAALPASLLFLKNPYFTPMGNQLDAVVYIAFAAVMVALKVFYKDEHRRASSPLLLGGLVLYLAGIAVTVYSIVSSGSFLLPPVNISWYAAVETLKQPVTALFGVGINNYSSMFTRVKDPAYNSTGLWQIGSFNSSISAILQILTETGVFGIAVFGLMGLQLFKRNFGNRKHLIVLGFALLVALLTPMSMTVLFLLFALLSGIGVEEKTDNEAPLIIHLGKVLPLFIAVLILIFGSVGVAGYFGGRAYAAELYFKRAVDSIATSNAKNVYENMRTAIMINPYIERYRINFAQTNLLIANNIAQKATQQAKKGQGTQLSDQDRQTISQAIQAAIDEAKAAVTLNPQNASNWENLGTIYRNILNVAQGADNWTISAYQRAIILDPQNPTYRVELGGVLFGLRNYDQAISLFQQAVGLKPDWANAYYNLAFAAYQKQDYQTAASAMQTTVSLLDPKKDAADYKQANAYLKEFLKKVPSNEDATKSATQQPSSKLSVPSPAAQPIQPKIELPKNASPAAR